MMMCNDVRWMWFPHLRCDLQPRHVVPLLRPEVALFADRRAAVEADPALGALARVGGWGRRRGRGEEEEEDEEVVEEEKEEV